MRLLCIFVSSVLYAQSYLVWESEEYTDHHEEIDISYSFSEEDVVEPLFLTPLLKRGHLHKARMLSKVDWPFQCFPSYSGYLTVNDNCESNLFFWFFPSESKIMSAPLVLWLQGGPGGSSLFGLLEEVGPIKFEHTIVKRLHNWNKENHLLFIDQPAGTGYSFTEKECYATDIAQVQEELYSALLQFYQLFPELISNKFYLAGESYAGHYIPAIGYTIHRRNPSAEVKINLSGMLIGNGMMDLTYQSNYGEYLYQLGLIDDYQLHAHSWELLTSFSEIVGNISKYNYLKPHIEIHNQPWTKYIQTSDIRRALHVGNQPFYARSEVVHTALSGDFNISVKPQVEELLEHYPMVFYYGQLDIICAYPMAVRFFRALNWSGQADYHTAKRQHWCVKGDLAGYIKSGHNLHEVMVRGAGHMVPQDQPLLAYLLASSVTSNPAENPLHGLGKCLGQ